MDSQKVANQSSHQDKIIKPMNGLMVLILTILLYVITVGGTIYMASYNYANAFVVMFYVFTGIYAGVIGPMLFCGLKVINPNEALVLTLFGQYYGTISSAGYYFVNPFCAAVNPTAKQALAAATTGTKISGQGVNGQAQMAPSYSKKVSLKAMTLNNDKQKVNDQSGNPIEIGVIVIWKVVNAAKAVLDVENYITYVSTQCDSAIRNVARQYPYDISSDGDEKSLRGSSQEIAEVLREELQKRTEIAGIEILEARISHLAYAQEIAAAMLQRQQADAIIAARQKIVEGAVGMVEMALTKLSENQIVELDDERKAQMVSNLLVVLCGNKDAQPIVNSGSIY